MPKMSDWLDGMGERAARFAQRRREAAERREAELTGPDTPPPADEPPPPAPPPPGARPEPALAIPWGMRVAAEAGWRLLVFAGVLYVLMKVVSMISLVIIAFSAGLLITALLQPTVSRLNRAGLPRGLATALTVLGGFVAIGLIGWFVTWQVMENADQLTNKVQHAIEDGRKWLTEGPFKVSEEQINDVADNLSNWLGENTSELTAKGFEGVSYFIEFLSGAAVAAFTTIFLLYDGKRIWKWTLNFVPGAARAAVAGAGPRVWATLTGYVRGTVLVALVDAVFIGLGLFLLDVPLAVPLGVLVFLFAFIPIVGALVSGCVAVVIAFVTNGLVIALLALGVVLLVQQIEGHVLQPFILGRMVRVHPLAVVLAVAAGTLIAGIAGAVVAVPLVAVVNTAVGYLRAYHREQLARQGAAPPGPHGATLLQVSPAGGPVPGPAGGPEDGPGGPSDGPDSPADGAADRDQ
ncbi:AI-2E family transporter [Streptomyces sp. NPDC051940]|uniref:AI-2E family transporter n=1 Tax=Streptomyces sp. NPDC051940 TaxID=3155675 RepID=UPI00342D3AF1